MDFEPGFTQSCTMGLDATGTRPLTWGPRAGVAPTRDPAPAGARPVCSGRRSDARAAGGIRPLLRAIGLMMAAAFLASAGTAQEFRDWTLDRDGDVCTVSTRVLLRSTGTLLVAVSLSARGPDGALMAIEVPVGASLRDRVAYVHGPHTPERALEWQFCNPDTCLAVTDLDQAALRALKRGTRITVGFRPLPSSPVLATPVSLMGLTRAWAALASCSDG